MQHTQVQHPWRAEPGAMSTADGTADRLEEYFASFRGAFRRRDQIRWATVYAQGLLSAGERKNVGTLARHVVLPPDLQVEDVAQALQNFVNQSPWDETPVWRRFRSLFRDEFRDGEGEGEGVFVVDELAFGKQGRHSVGVQRQYSSLLGRKSNCQIAVALWHVHPRGVLPLGIRLYLPRAWVQSAGRLDAAAVPLAYRTARDKTQIALELLDEVRADGWTNRPVLAAAGPARDHTFRAGLVHRGLAYVVEWSPDLVLAEGETVVRLNDATSLTTNHAESARRIAWAAVHQETADFRRHLMQELGLDHFEGRSWRGFHHHACLVALAFGFHWRQRQM